MASSSRGRNPTAMEAQQIDHLRKKLFASGSEPEEEEEVSEELDNLLSKLRVEYNAEHSLKGMQKELHEQRLKKLREQLKKISEDDWRYTPVEKLIGLQ